MTKRLESAIRRWAVVAVASGLAAVIIGLSMLTWRALLLWGCGR
jgi:hypothetical protein